MTEVKFIETVSIMEDLARELGFIPRIIEGSKELFRELLQNYIDFSRHPYDLVALAALYYKVKKDPSCPIITLKYFAQNTPYGEREIRRLYNKIVKIKKEKPVARAIRLAKYAREFGKRGGFTQETIDRTVKLTEEISEKGVLIGRTPIAIVAACLYFTIHLPGERRNQDEVSELGAIANSTLRDILKQSFFVERKSEHGIKRYGGFEPVDRRALSKLLSKLLLKIEYEIPFPQIRSTLRRTYPVALRSYTIPTYRLRTAFKGLESKGLLFLIDGPECSGKESICKYYCNKNTCRDSVIYPQRAAILKYPQSS